MLKFSLLRLHQKLIILICVARQLQILPGNLKNPTLDQRMSDCFSLSSEIDRILRPKMMEFFKKVSELTSKEEKEIESLFMKETASTRVCIKKDVLVKKGYKNIDDWMSRPNHLYVGRDMSRFPALKSVLGSKWANPYPVGKRYTLEESLRLYTEYLDKSPELLKSLHELKGKVIGCWCQEGAGNCHGDILISRLI